MYVKINDIVDGKTVYLAYPVQGKEVAIVSMFSENIRYKFTEHWTIELGSRNKLVMVGTYMRRELIDLTEGKIKLNPV